MSSGLGRGRCLAVAPGHLSRNRAVCAGTSFLKRQRLFRFNDIGAVSILWSIAQVTCALALYVYPQNEKF
jgi:hypothetical protein